MTGRSNSIPFFASKQIGSRLPTGVVPTNLRLLSASLALSSKAVLQSSKQRGVCTAADTAAGFGGTLRIEDEFWPYHPSTNVSTAQCTNGYIAAIRQQFLALGCTTGRFG